MISNVVICPQYVYVCDVFCDMCVGFDIVAVGDDESHTGAIWSWADKQKAVAEGKQHEPLVSFMVAKDEGMHVTFFTSQIGCIQSTSTATTSNMDMKHHQNMSRACL